MSVLDNKHEPYLKKSFGLNFRIGLVVALGLCIMAFKITVPVDAENQAVPHDIDEIVFIEPTPPRTERDAPKPPPKTVTPKIIKPLTIYNPVVATKPIADPDPGLIDIPDEGPIDEPPVIYNPTPKEPVTWAEVMPEFKGDLTGYLSDTPYCGWAQEVDAEGTVYASFVVNEEGKVVDVKIERSVFPCLDEAVVEHLKNMPDWEPGKMQGHPVKVRMGVPIKFQVR